MATLSELETELGLAPGTLTAKPEVATKWNGLLTDGETKLAAAQKALTDAQNLQRVIDENIEKNGLNETNIAQLRASNAAMAAALAEVKKAGFTGITIPEFAVTAPANANPLEELKTLIVKGFTTSSQAMDVANRYFRVFGKAMPDNPTALADEAAKHRLDVATYAEQKYGFAAAEQKLQAEATAKRETEIAERAVAKWKEDNPSTVGNAHLQPGVPSDYPAIPKPREGASVREFAGMTARQKIENSMKRNLEAVAQRGAA